MDIHKNSTMPCGHLFISPIVPTKIFILIIFIIIILRILQPSILLLASYPAQYSTVGLLFVHVDDARQVVTHNVVHRMPFDKFLRAATFVYYLCSQIDCVNSVC